MADILDFRPADDKTGRRARHTAQASGCEIVIFPGVRYERWEDDGGNNPTPQPKRKRALRARAQKAG